MQDVNHIHATLDDELYALINKYIEKDNGILEIAGDDYFRIRNKIVELIDELNK